MVVLLFLACSTKPQAIKYGFDSCHFCRMTIVDKIHAAEIVTKKGKVFKFDAVECMINYNKEINDETVAKYLTNHYENPEELIDATKASFFVSESVPSPMGEFLTAFKAKTEAERVRVEKEGEIYSWEEILNRLNQ
ncbi:nitrous oxide reductase accessory protein NosL [Aquimarina sp. 2304DJ70-9]|uniref:nitrous oxide reductase accessory protein NosL n=1 Tax=Aquimarina penaris TaxID=3231044 RepID=UPI0034634EAE